MKTLDEVIKAWSICFSDNSRSNCTGCPYADDDGEAACFNHDREDALHYLKVYKNTDENYRKAITHVNKIIDHNEKMVADYLSTNNPALSWDELKHMEGKPIWVEIVAPDNWKAWFLISGIDDSFLWVFDSKGDTHNFPRVCLDTRLWQAYRKEREC